MNWACLLLPQLALDGVLRRQPDLNRPLALVTGPIQRRVLHSINPAARGLGLRPGMALATAQALSADFATISYDAQETQRWHKLLAAWAYRFSSHVSTDFDHAIVLEVGRSLRLFGPWPRFEAQLREELTALGFRHRIVAAPNPHAARVLANVEDGLAVDARTLERALGQVTVQRAGLDKATAQALAGMGLRTLRQVFALPREAVTRRFPKTVLPHLDALRSAHPAPLSYYQPPDHFDQNIELEQEVESNQALLFPLRRLTRDLATFLAGRDGGVQQFVLTLEHERTTDTDVRVGLLAPERDPAMLFELARGRLEQAQVPAPVRGLRLQARELPPFVPADRDLFDTRPQQAVPWAQLRERLRARLGDASVHGISLHPDHRPELAWRPEDVICKTPPPFLPRPGWLLSRPVPLRGYGLQVLAGPERVEAGWWDGGDIRRDYYVVETDLGQRAWAFRAAGEPSGPFMLHGWFA